MEFRKAVKADAISIMNIVKQAQDYLKEQKVDQWQNNYPNIDTIKHDIYNGNSYVILKDNCVIGTVAVIFTGEKTYDTIYNGNWISNNQYAVIHRMAIEPNNKGLGLSSVILENIEELCHDRGISSIKVDTHKENIAMQKFLQKSGFQYCGVIYLEDGNERVAFEKIFGICT